MTTMSGPNSAPTIPASQPTQHLHTLRQPIKCAVSGSVLGILDVQLVEGSLPFIQDFARIEMMHPFFGQTDYHLMKKFKESLDWFHLRDWDENPHQVSRLQILMSATMHRLGVLKQEFPTVPSFQVCVGSAHRVYHIANWWLLNTTKRAALPWYSISSKNENTNWETIRWWLDECYNVKNAYESKVRQIEHDEEVKARESAMKEIKSEHMRRIDVRKVWNWVEIQLLPECGSKRLVTYKDLFMSGDLEPEKWIADDIDDLVVDIEEHCDTGNEIMFYIKNRLKAIRETINDFYGSFTVVNLRLGGGEVSELERKKEEELFSGFDKAVEVLEVMPNEPQAKDFATVGLYLKAKANWKLLESRFKLMQSKLKDQIKLAEQLTSKGAL